MKLGIIQNEFAPSNIDGAELKKSGEDFNLLEINNGSVFCVCLLGDFVRSLEKFIGEHQPDMLIIEASGLSDTTSIAEVLSSGSLSEKIVLASNWCIVDAVNFEKVGLMKQRVTHQLRMADVVLVNKSDLITRRSARDKLIREVKQHNPFAEVLFTAWCDVNFNPDSKAVNKFYMGEMKTLSRPDINSMVIKSGRKLPRQSLERFLAEWAPKAYRMKGFVNLKEEKTAAIHCTFGTVEITETERRMEPSELIALTDQFTLREWSRSFKNYS